MIDNESINRAIDYILDHINEELTLDEVAIHCHFSKYYFSRLFKLATGESVYEFIKRVRMEQSAFKLKVERGRSITDIGLTYGYSASNYSSVFKEHHRRSPIVFRRQIRDDSLQHPNLSEMIVELETLEACNQKIRVEILEDYYVIYERYIGNYGDLGARWKDFQDKYQAYMTSDTVLIERTFDDPSITRKDRCLYDICMSIHKDCSLENTYLLRGGKFAIYAFKGSIHEIYGAYQSIFNVWLPESKHTLDERYGFERYRKVDCDRMYMEIDLCIPIK